MCHGSGPLNSNVSAEGDYLCGTLCFLLLHLFQFYSFLFSSFLFSSFVKRAYLSPLADSPFPLVISALKYMKTVEPNPDFILCTGALAVIAPFHRLTKWSA